MMSPVFFNGKGFRGIKEFDCVTVSLFTEEALRGEFHTNIPISDKEYRSENPTKAKVDVVKRADWTVFHIYSDHGDLYKVEIHNSQQEQIAFAEEKAKEYNLVKQ